MHGSLLPKYRGRVPINWAIIHGETETGATLHVMNVKPDNGPIVDQMAVPILPDDNADEVFAKVTVAAEMVLARSLPALLAGQTEFRQQDLSLGGYFGGRKPEDGRIDPLAGAAQLHNFVRALSHPFRGLRRHRKRPAGDLENAARRRHGQALQGARLRAYDGALWLEAVDGGCLKVLSATLDGAPLEQLAEPLALN